MPLSCVAQHNLLCLLIGLSNESQQLGHKDYKTHVLCTSSEQGSSMVLMSAVSEASSSQVYVLNSLSVSPWYHRRHLQLQTVCAMLLAAAVYPYKDK